MRTPILIFLLICGLWLVRYQATKPPVLPDGVQVRLRGCLRQEPVSSLGRSQQFILQGVEIKARSFPEYHYGDCLEVVGVVQSGQLSYPEIKLLTPGDERLAASGRLLGFLFRFRERVEQIYQQNLPEPQASLLSGIVLGQKKSLPLEFSQALKKTGVMHVVVASGANISLVSQPLVDGLAGFLPRPIVLPLAAGLIWLYAAMAGFGAPVVRAALMASLAFLAQFSGRERSGLWSLLLTALVMLFIKPALLFDLGFQLSFGATLGILLFYPRWRPYFQRLKFFGNDLATTLAAQVFVLPLIYFHFHQISWLGPLVNALVLWTIDPLMKLGGALGLIGLASQPLARLIAYPAWLLLTIFIKIIEFFG